MSFLSIHLTTTAVLAAATTIIINLTGGFLFWGVGVWWVGSDEKKL